MKITKYIIIFFLSFVCIQNLMSQDYGNTTAQEYGDPAYRILDFFGYNYNHTGINAGMNSGHYKRVRQALGSGYTTHETYLTTAFTDFGIDYYGAYTLSTYNLDFYSRRVINLTARDIVDAAIEYPGDYINPIPVCLEYYGFSFDGSIADISNIRCDGVVEYCYEKNGFRVWRSQDYSDSYWSIVTYPDTHNNRPDLDRDPDFEASPWAQRGAPCGTGPNPENGCDYASSDTRMTRAAVINLPTYQVSQVTGNGYTDVTVQATDESGIHYIGYKKPGDTAWSYSTTQTQDPSYNTYSYTVRVYSSGNFYTFAIDNGGNYPSSVSGYYVTVGSIPSVPNLVSPSNYAIDVDIAPTLTWNTVANATSYNLEVYEVIDATPTLKFSYSGLTNTYKKLPDLKHETLHFWKVSATNDYGTSDFSSFYRFTTAEEVGIEISDSDIPSSFHLWQNYPNPFNPETTIRFSIPQRGFTSLNIFNTVGEKIDNLVNSELVPGYYSVKWRPENIPSGIYFYHLESAGFENTKKLFLMK